MKKIVTAAFMIIFALAAASAEPPKAASDPYHEWFTYYYVYRDDTEVPDFLTWLQSSGTLETIPESTPPMEGFLSALFAANPSKVEGWTRTTVFSGKTKAVIDYAVKPPVAPEKAAINSTEDLTRAWASFFASGNTLYLEKIVGTLDRAVSPSGNVKQDEIIRDAAATSLGSNMTQHEAVDRFLAIESEKRTGYVGDILKGIVSDVRKQRDARAFPHRDGEFSAIMFITDPKAAESEFAKTSQNALHFKEMAHARVGEKRTVVIIFAGQQLTPDYVADVTYDEQLVNPKGEIYSDVKNLEAVKGKLPTRFRVFNNKAAVFIAFDKKDKPGIYKINVLLKDNIGNKTLTLTDKITFGK